MAEEHDQDKQKPHPLPWLNSLVTDPFYASHALTFFSYLILRQSASPWLSQDFSYRLFRREIQGMCTFAVIATLKVLKSDSWESFIADITLYAKAFLLMLAFMLDCNVAFWYIIIFIVIFLLFPQSSFSGQGKEKGNVQYLTPLQLESILTDGSSTKMWLVEFRALWSSSCVKASRCMPELSRVYSNENLSFAVVDLGRFPNAASKFGVSLNVNMGQLPTFILFKNGVELSRIPEMDSEAKLWSPKITKGTLVKHFELDHLLIEFLLGGRNQPKTSS